MKQIQSFPISTGGPLTTLSQVNAFYLSVVIEGDNLVDTCYLYFQLFDINQTSIYQGHTSITGVDYINWAGDNTYPYQYIAQLYSITIIN